MTESGECKQHIFTSEQTPDEEGYFDTISLLQNPTKCPQIENTIMNRGRADAIDSPSNTTKLFLSKIEKKPSNTISLQEEVGGCSIL